MSASDAALREAIRRALDAEPRNAALWAHYGELLVQAGEGGQALDAFRNAVACDEGDPRAGRRLVALLREQGHLAEALIRVEALLAAHADAGLELELARILLARGEAAGAREHYDAAVAADATLADADLEQALRDAPAAAPASDSGADERIRASVRPDPAAIEDVLSSLDLDDLVVRFEDVVGLDEVKNQIRLRIIAPFERRDVFRAFKRKAGGGILLYGPPGCGKTFVARATAGECNARFVAISISEVVDQYFGQSEKMIHDLFEKARREAPTILFFDEFDAIGTSRGRSDSQFWRTLVNQILMEMDGMVGGGEGVLVFAATNLPWNVDSAFRRPGRFDRSLFVPPPDPAGREELLRRVLADVPGGDAIDAAALAKRTDLLTGADLEALVERASDRALAASLEGDTVHPVTAEDLERALGETPSTALEWLANARNYARYANEGGQYDDLIAFLKRVKRW